MRGLSTFRPSSVSCAPSISPTSSSCRPRAFPDSSEISWDSKGFAGVVSKRCLFLKEKSLPNLDVGADPILVALNAIWPFSTPALPPLIISALFLFLLSTTKRETTAKKRTPTPTAAQISHPGTSSSEDAPGVFPLTTLPPTMMFFVLEDSVCSSSLVDGPAAGSSTLVLRLM